MIQEMNLQNTSIFQSDQCIDNLSFLYLNDKNLHDAGTQNSSLQVYYGLKLEPRMS